MIRALRKGQTYISVMYKNDYFSNNLYCSTSLEIEDNRTTIILDFKKIKRSKIKTDSNDDLDYLMEYIENLSSIEFNDEQITKKLIYNGVKQNSNILVKLISETSKEVQMNMVYMDSENFKLKTKI